MGVNDHEIDVAERKDLSDAAGYRETIERVGIVLEYEWRCELANSFGSDILIQVPDPQRAAEFYVKQLGFAVAFETPMIALKGENINLYIDQGPSLGPVLEVFVPSVEAARDRLVASGCTVVREEPAVPRCYVRDPFGLIYNLAGA